MSESRLNEWRETVGPPVFYTPAAVSMPNAGAGRIIVVNWNIHVGHGRIAELVNRLTEDEHRQGFGRPEFVMLLQEAFRRGAEVPSVEGRSVPGRIAPPSDTGDIEDVARKMNWWMYYAPSMRNGAMAGDAAEDRGNAILSSLPLDDIEAIELPFVVQRRVALTATVTDTQKTPLMRVAVAHLDTRAPFFKGWIFGGPGARNTQAAGVASALTKLGSDGLPLVLGGDLNTMFGARESSVKTVSSVIARRECGADATHKSGFALDHIFARIPESWSGGACTRIDETFGSDHYPLVLPLASLD